MLREEKGYDFMKFFEFWGLKRGIRKGNCGWVEIIRFWAYLPENFRGLHRNLTQGSLCTDMV